MNDKEPSSANKRKTYTSELLKLIHVTYILINKKAFNNKIGYIGLNISSKGFEVMSILLEEGPMNITTIGRKLIISRSQMTQLVEKLVNQRMVYKKVNKQDKRSFIVGLTKIGEKTVSAHIYNWERAGKEIMAKLKREERHNLTRLLQKLNTILLSS